MQAWRRCCFCLCQAAAAAAAAASAIYICASVELKHVHCVLQEVLVGSAGMAPLQFVANRWLAVDELDSSTYVTLTASGGKSAVTKKYMIQVGMRYVYCVMFGQCFVHLATLLIAVIQLQHCEASMKDLVQLPTCRLMRHLPGFKEMALSAVCIRLCRCTRVTSGVRGQMRACSSDWRAKGAGIAGRYGWRTARTTLNAVHRCVSAQHLMQLQLPD
jgi:hypothetical protein